MPSSIDDDLNSIERDIRTLKIEYEQFFGGGRKRPLSTNAVAARYTGAPVQRESSPS